MTLPIGNITEAFYHLDKSGDELVKLMDMVDYLKKLAYETSYTEIDSKSDKILTSLMAAKAQHFEYLRRVDLANRAFNLMTLKLLKRLSNKLPKAEIATNVLDMEKD